MNGGWGMEQLGRWRPGAHRAGPRRPGRRLVRGEPIRCVGGSRLGAGGADTVRGWEPIHLQTACLTGQIVACVGLRGQVSMSSVLMWPRSSLGTQVWSVVHPEFRGGGVSARDAVAYQPIDVVPRARRGCRYAGDRRPRSISPVSSPAAVPAVTSWPRRMRYPRRSARRQGTLQQEGSRRRRTKGSRECRQPAPPPPQHADNAHLGPPRARARAECRSSLRPRGCGGTGWAGSVC